MRHAASYQLPLLLVAITLLVVLGGLAANRSEKPGTAQSRAGGDTTVTWPLSEAPAGMIALDGGTFVFGSSERQKELGYRLDDRYARFPPYASRRQRWYHYEANARVETMQPFAIDRFPVTNTAFKRFVEATGLPAPDVSQATWQQQGLVHPWERVQKYRWRADRPPAGRGDHPVVLVDWATAEAYCLWHGEQIRQRQPSSAGRLEFRLPTGAEFERAARGRSGRTFPWGEQFEPGITNVVYYLDGERHGPFDTVPIDTFPGDETPEGIRHLGGMVFEWTATPWHSNRIWEPGAGYDPQVADTVVEQARAVFRNNPARALEVLRRGDHRHEIRGGSWDDLPGITRGSARHSRPSGLHHILVGFRCAAVLTE